MPQRLHTKSEACAILDIDPKTFDKWVQRVEPPIVLEQDKRDKRIRRISLSDIQRLAKELGKPLGNPQEKIAQKNHDSGDLAELQQKVSALEGTITDLRERLTALEARKAPATPREPSAARGEHRVSKGTDDNARELLAQGYQTIPDFALAHGMLSRTVADAAASGKLEHSKGRWIIRDHVVNVLLAPQSHNQALTLWTYLTRFHPCERCPQEQQSA